ncbi:DNA replication complex GINS family protein [Acidianus manzaensis]|uniref:GINS subunit domain-containing protein n=1 Tax=Acidianus manzaensis TaxID=282676 RepID=A0A1W6JZN3_9CREN|nr:DNA replication complex GINS family protein [Acidianus manzaensis]ARM75685.1 hypothetical protein B6F84_06285 [Acidianus manzaensis]
MFKVMLRAINRLQQVENKKVAIYDDIGPLDLGFTELILNKGSEDEIPLWIASELEKSDKVKVYSISLEELGKIIFQEKQNINTPASLVKVYPDLYFRIKKLSNELKNQGIDGLESIKKINSIVNEISNIRLRKIIQLALLNIDDKTVINKMTKEEYLVYASLKSIISSFYGDVIGSSI